jgi:5-formyltetrahydrofolate cyclo-ligase
MQDARLRLAASEVARCSAAACDAVLRLPSFAGARHLVAYAAIENEVDPVVIVERALEAGKAVYFPRDGGGRLEFVAAPAAALRARERQIPVPPDGPPLPPRTESVLFLVPGVAFDEIGGRLGRGRGWYDRALARHAGGLRVGLAYDFQVVPRLPEAAWDVRMHAVVTEARLVGDLSGGYPAKENQP